MRLVPIGFAIATIGITIGITIAACSSRGSGSARGTGGALDGASWRLGTYDVLGSATDVPVGMVVDAGFAGRVAGNAGWAARSARLATREEGEGPNRTLPFVLPSERLRARPERSPGSRG